MKAPKKAVKRLSWAILAYSAASTLGAYGYTPMAGLRAAWHRADKPAISAALASVP